METQSHLHYDFFENREFTVGKDLVGNHHVCTRTTGNCNRRRQLPDQVVETWRHTKNTTMGVSTPDWYSVDTVVRLPNYYPSFISSENYAINITMR